MQIQGHLKAAPALGLLYFVGGIESVIIAIVASIIIDIDHLHVVVKEKAFTYKKIIELSQNIYDQSSIKRCFRDVTYALHTIEINILLLVLSNWYTPLFYVAIGFLFHTICDIIHHRRQKLPILTWLILTSYFIRLIKGKNL